MRHLSLLLVLALPVAVNAAEEKPAASVVQAPVASARNWSMRGGWDSAAFNRSVQVDAPGRSALKSKGKYSLEVVASGERGDVLLRFFDAAGAPLAQVPAHVRGVEQHETASAPKGAVASAWQSGQKWSDAGFDGASPFASKALGDGSVRVELRSSKYPGLFIEGTLPAVQRTAR
jgi:hypothetical protein